MSNWDYLFGLRVKFHDGTLTVRAYDANRTSGYGHSYIDIEVKWNGRVLFKRGDTNCGVNAWTSIDGKEARELVLSTLAMKPGDTDPGYFDNYTPEQLEWASSHGEELSMIAEDRYGRS